jgi:hypothetical protein
MPRLVQDKNKAPTHGFFILEHYPIHAWTLSDGVLGPQVVTEIYIREPAVLLFEGSDGYRFAVVLQQRDRSIYANVVCYWEGEHSKDVLARYQRELEPRDRVTFKLSQEKVVSVNIRKCLGGHVAGIATRSDESPTKPELDEQFELLKAYKSTDLNRT